MFSESHCVLISITHPSIHLHICPSIHPHAHQFIHPSNHLHLPSQLSIYLTNHICPPTPPSIHPSIHFTDQVLPWVLETQQQIKKTKFNSRGKRIVSMETRLSVVGDEWGRDKVWKQVGEQEGWNGLTYWCRSGSQ